MRGAACGAGVVRSGAAGPQVSGGEGGRAARSPGGRDVVQRHGPNYGCTGTTGRRGTPALRAEGPGLLGPLRGSPGYSPETGSQPRRVGLAAPAARTASSSVYRPVCTGSRRAGSWGRLGTAGSAL